MDPFPKTYAPGSTLTLRAHGDPNYRLKLWIDDKNGNALGVPFTQESNGSFSVSERLPTQPGHYYVAVTVDENDERQLAYLVPVHVGVPEPLNADDQSLGSLSIPADDAGWRDALLQVINQERSRASLPALALDPGLSNMAGSSPRKVRPGIRPIGSSLRLG